MLHLIIRTLSGSTYCRLVEDPKGKGARHHAERIRLLAGESVVAASTTREGCVC